MSKVEANVGKTEVLSGDIELITFDIGDRLFGIEVGFVDSFIEKPKLTKPPTADDDVIGVFDYRGTIISCVSLASVLKIPLEGVSLERLIVANIGDRKCAFEVGGDSQIARFPRSEVSPIPELVGNSDGMLSGVLNYKERILVILDLNAVLSSIINGTPSFTSDVLDLVDESAGV